MVNGARAPQALGQTSPDLVVGRLIDAGLQAQVSVRGGSTVVLMLARDARGLEVSFTPKAARQLAEIVEAAAKVAEGRG